MSLFHWIREPVSSLNDWRIRLTFFLIPLISLSCSVAFSIFSFSFYLFFISFTLSFFLSFPCFFFFLSFYISLSFSSLPVFSFPFFFYFFCLFCHSFVSSFFFLSFLFLYLSSFSFYLFVCFFLSSAPLLLNATGGKRETEIQNVRGWMWFWASVSVTGFLSLLMLWERLASTNKKFNLILSNINY